MFLENKLHEYFSFIDAVNKSQNMSECGCRDLNPSYKLGNRVSTGEKQRISNDVFNKFLTLRELERLSKKWHYQGKLCLNKYLNFVNWKINESKTLEYYQSLKNNLSISYYKKEVYQIRKFLTYLKIEWANDVKLPADPIYLPKRVAIEDINKSLDYFKDNKFYLQAKALIFLGMSSGARALELYQLTIEDIDIENRVLHINHNPQNGQSTKTKLSRISFFTEEAKQAIGEYLTYFDSDASLKVFFSPSHISRLFRNSPVKVKDLRKYFSQEWDRRGGPTSIKKILMGHSLRGDVDLMHYNAQSEEDLKKIYDKV
ncbi:MAG: site-specific integrase, partial [Candidatus Thermoplasmatota archaeon]|nr:site-specific integrase [Candidatus Thermoplasmatota archaeon]